MQQMAGNIRLLIRHCHGTEVKKVSNSLYARPDWATETIPTGQLKERAPPKPRFCQVPLLQACRLTQGVHCECTLLHVVLDEPGDGEQVLAEPRGVPQQQLPRPPLPHAALALALGGLFAQQLILASLPEKDNYLTSFHLTHHYPAQNIQHTAAAASTTTTCTACRRTWLMVSCAARRALRKARWSSCSIFSLLAASSAS